MFTIGEFSKVTGLTVKTLRFYHERGLLIPSRVETGSGYRYYDQQNVETARAIRSLRELEFSLEEITEILQNHGDETDIVSFLERRKQALRQRITQDRDLVAKIDLILKNEKEAREMARQTEFEIETKDLPSILVGGIRMKGRYEDCGTGFATLGRKLGRHSVGKPLCLFYDREYRDDDADFEPCMPLRRRVESDGINVRELGGGRCISLIHHGPYSELSRSYERLILHSKDEGLRLLVPSREVYIKGPGMIFRGNPKNYVTEIQMLVDEEAAGSSNG